MDDKIEQVRDNLIVSCQALEDEPLHSSFIMGRMAKAAQQGGAKGIRANTVEDITEIRKNVDLPIIGIIKRDYPDSEIYITPTMKEVDELMAVKPDIMALDATNRKRPGDVSLDEFYREVRSKYPDQLLMADCSSIDEALHADELGFDFIGTTMVGYTSYTKDDRIESHTFEIIREILKKVKHPVIAEGNIDTPEKAREVLDLGCFAVVVGGAITRPQNITKKFVAAVNNRPKYSV
ncbi:N-acetylmannosamine-6-phosphate 2-epimerase [Oribacterium sp. WCC10]|uniref:N-acetylmannosamine-6-phosphate 2-epimerase n=1 Tax=Oribacterium sp. WCC10 TaxID=1855343 RepID=UPI0008E3502C|nr:N-acetylmannosamine-6-phosphate 2-epimerase [Oribacterium sp. WCC10]SFG16301.1 N-acylglucosamine-6-phosphate 2-epimerase [Oribacterium sp. WCC10]